MPDNFREGIYHVLPIDASTPTAAVVSDDAADTTNAAISPNTIFLTDMDVDQSGSVVAALLSEKHDAFSRPSIVCGLIDKIPDDEVVHIIINTLGGAMCHLEKIAKKLMKHPAGYIVYIKNECYSAGAILALGASEIVMNSDSYIGKIDPQQEGRQLMVYTRLDEKNIDSANAYMVEEAKYVLNYMRQLLDIILQSNDTSNETKDAIIKHLLESELPHETLFNFDDCKDLIKLRVREPTKNEECYFKTHEVVDHKVKAAPTRWETAKSIIVTAAIVIPVAWWMWRYATGPAKVIKIGADTPIKISIDTPNLTRIRPLSVYDTPTYQNRIDKTFF